MKYRSTKSPLLRSALFGVVLLLSACVNTLELASPHKSSEAKRLEQAVDGAMCYFGTHQELRTRSANAEPTEEAPFVVGNLVPDWSSAVSVANEEKQYTDFAMRKDYDFYWLPDGDVEQRVKLYSRFASVEEFALDTINQYVATYIPDEEYLGSYRAVAQDYGINCAEWYEFSGTVLYTMISGHIVAAAHYTKGELTKSAFLYDREKTTEENIADFYAIVEGITMGIAPSQQTTRTIIPDIIWKDPNTGIIYKFMYMGDYDYFTSGYDPLSSKDYIIVEPVLHNHTSPIGMGGGGSNGSSTEEKLTAEKFSEKILKNTLNPTDSAQLHSMLTEILNDCMGETLLQKIYSKGLQIEVLFNSDTQNPHYTFNYKIDSVGNITNTYDYSITLKSNQGYALLHELFHFYQHQVLGTRTFLNAKSNYEVEAYLATYMYMDRIIGDQMDKQKQEFKEEVCIGNQVVKLYSMVLDNASFVDYNECDYFHQLFLATAKHYSKANNTPYNDAQTIEQHIQNLEHVTILCN